jgi:flagellar motor switch protein FliN/FliY
MTATMSQAIDLLTTMVESAAQAVQAAVGAPIHVGQAVTVPVNEALGVGGCMISRSQLSAGPNTGSLLTIVPAAGLVSTEGAIDAANLTTALVTGAVAGMVAAGGPALQPSPPQLVPSSTSVDPHGSEAIAFDLVVGTRSITVLWVVEATLVALLGGAIPVDGSATEGTSVAPAALPDLGRAGTVNSDHPIETLSAVVTHLSVEIARGSVFVRDLVNMAPGSVFELDREAGDVVDILINGSRVARGDIVVVGNQLGVRFVEVCEPSE